MQDKLDWSDVPVLLAFGRTGTIADAAAMLGIDETTASRRLKRLEASLGSTLVTKTSGKMVLTPVGKLAVERAQQMEDAANLLVRDHAARNPTIDGTVRVTGLHYILNFVIVPILPDLLLQYPRLTVQIQAENRNLDVAGNETDIAIRMAAPAVPDAAGLVSAPLGRMAFATYRRRGYFEGLSLQRCPWIGPDDEYSRIPEGRWLTETVPPERIVLRTNSTLTNMAAVKSGVGCAMLPVLLGDNDRDLVRKGDGVILYREMSLLWRRASETEGAIGVTVARIRQAFKDLAPQIGG